ncbi:MAG: MaoC/PaaZ C-terminal domain-containing protein [Geminicoccaceae bacterium]
MSETAERAVTLQDLRVGQVFETGSVVIGHDAIVAFAAQYDPQPMHLDDVAARDTLFGGLVASGWHVAALTTRLVVDARPFGATPLIGAEIERLRFRRPVRPDTRLTARLTVESIEESRRPDTGYARIRVETLDADTGEVLMAQGWKMLLPVGRVT